MRVGVGLAVGVRVGVGEGVAVGEAVGAGLAVGPGVGVGVGLTACDTAKVTLPEVPPKPPAWIQYVVPDWATNCTSEVGAPLSSLQMSWTNAPLGTV